MITSEIRKCIHHWVQYIWHRASRPVTCHWVLASNILDNRYPWKLMWVSKNNFIFCNQVYVAVIWVMFCQIPWKYGARGLRRICSDEWNASGEEYFARDGLHLNGAEAACLEVCFQQAMSTARLTDRVTTARTRTRRLVKLGFEMVALAVGLAVRARPLVHVWDCCPWVPSEVRILTPEVGPEHLPDVRNSE